MFIDDEFTNEQVFYFTDKLKITEYLSYFVEVRNLDEAVIFESSGQLLAKVGSFLVESENRHHYGHSSLQMMVKLQFFLIQIKLRLELL